jgi:hypothetical protein
VTIGEYKEQCNLIFSLPPESGLSYDFFSTGQWTEEERMMLDKLHTLFMLACDIEIKERAPFLDHWWGLPVGNELKREVLNNIAPI